jgi:hypothetical protein
MVGDECAAGHPQPQVLLILNLKAPDIDDDVCLDGIEIIAECQKAMAISSCISPAHFVRLSRHVIVAEKDPSPLVGEILKSTPKKK